MKVLLIIPLEKIQKPPINLLVPQLEYLWSSLLKHDPEFSTYV